MDSGAIDSFFDSFFDVEANKKRQDYSQSQRNVLDLVSTQASSLFISAASVPILPNELDWTNITRLHLTGAPTIYRPICSGEPLDDGPSLRAFICTSDSVFAFNFQAGSHDVYEECMAKHAQRFAGRDDQPTSKFTGPLAKTDWASGKSSKVTMVKGDVFLFDDRLVITMPKQPKQKVNAPPMLLVASCTPKNTAKDQEQEIEKSQMQKRRKTGACSISTSSNETGNVAKWLVSWTRLTDRTVDLTDRVPAGLPQSGGPVNGSNFGLNGRSKFADSAPSIQMYAGFKKDDWIVGSFFQVPYHCIMGVFGKVASSVKDQHTPSGGNAAADELLSGGIVQHTAG